MDTANYNHTNSGYHEDFLAIRCLKLLAWARIKPAVFDLGSFSGAYDFSAIEMKFPTIHGVHVE